MTSECCAIFQNALLKFTIPHSTKFENSTVFWYHLSWLLWGPLYSAIQPCLTLCDLMGSSPPGFTVGLLPPGKNTGVCCHALLQGILPTQGLDPGLPYCRQFLFCLSHQRSTLILFVSFKYYFTYLFKHFFKNNVFLQKVI